MQLRNACIGEREDETEQLLKLYIIDTGAAQCAVVYLCVCTAFTAFIAFDATIIYESKTKHKEGEKKQQQQQQLC